VIPAGASLRVRPETLARKYEGKRFTASPIDPVLVNDRIVLPSGTRFNGHLTRSKPSGRRLGRAVIVVRLDSFDLNSRQYAIESGSIAYVSRSHQRCNLDSISRSKPNAFQAVSFQQVFSFERPESGRSCR
jgi:hypothetical protein